MLKILRKNMRLVFWIIAVLALPALAILFGGGPEILRSFFQARSAGRIFGKRVSWSEYYHASRAVRNQGSEMNPWHRIVLLHEANRRGVKVKDDEVIKEIENLSFLQKDGQFAPDRYDTYLAFLRSDRRTFEEEVRETLAIAKLMQTIRNEVVLADEDLLIAYREIYEKVRVDYLLFGWESFKENVSLADEEVASYWETNRTRFLREERVNIEFISFPSQEWEEKMEVSEEEIAQYYQDNKDLFRKTPPSSEEEEYLSLEEVKEKIEKGLIRDKAARAAEEECRNFARELKGAPQDWSIIAEKYSRTIQETGLFGRNELIPRIGWSSVFMQTAFGLSPEEISERIQVGGSMYLIRLKEKRAAHIPEFEEIKDEVKESLLEEKAREKARSKAESVAEEIGGDGAKFEVLVEEDNILLKEGNALFKETDLFSRDTHLPGIGANHEFAQAAFELNDDEPISRLISIPEGHALLRFKEFVAIDEKKISEEKEEFREKVLGRKQFEHYLLWWSNLLQEANIENYTENGEK